MSSRLFTGTNIGLMADWIEDQGTSVISVVPNRRLAEILYVNLQSFFEDRVGLFPAWDIKPGQDEQPGLKIQERRLAVLNRIKTGQIEQLILTVRALGAPTLCPSELKSFQLTVDDVISPAEIIRNLHSLGYVRQDLVESRGDFAKRGDLLDFYPDNFPFPLRISFFDNEIESIDYFHPNTQMQADETPPESIELHQRSEFSLSAEQRNKLQNCLRENGYYDRAEQFEVHTQPSEIANWFGLWPKELTVPEELLNTSTVAIHEPAKCIEEANEWNDLKQQTDNSIACNTFRKTTQVLQKLSETRQTTQFFAHYEETSLSSNDSPERLGQRVQITNSPGGDPSPISDFIDVIRDLCEQVQAILIHCGETGFRERLNDLLAEEFGSASEFNGTQIKLLDEPWHGSYRRNDMARISLDDFFNRTIQRGRIGQNRGRTEYLESFEDLMPGDLVVHEHFGIGRFEGLKRISTNSQTRDCLHLEYAEDDRLFLPPDQIAWVQKYIADSGFNPSLSKLSGGRWSQIKENVEEEISELATDLLELYTSREDQSGHSFVADSLEQKQFEANFPYRETPDQQDAIESVKSDMRSSEPMDRLICGDSGFGKTEVALRAAFKAVDSGRQVAMLVPTTVLARQHYETFNRRFSIFPYRVELLSRFQTQSEAKSIITDMESGDVDIVVGTHRLLSDDVTFDDIGLLIIDEEQRFGVEQKETLKLYRRNVDVLTLSATPIPRTLYMTLSGIHDISRINTPPEDRVPIKIHTGPFNSGTAKESIEHELSRGGQVFWVHNHVKSIRERTEYVQSLQPEAEVTFAHGQMSKSNLRDTMNRFYDGEIDILVCTTIIESGLDCPNVNTMILEHAHEFGLAQLYQLRGRVGRSHEQAFVNLFYPSDASLTDDARARLKAIKECSELGAGFNVAMRDLEIRGAGNILGTNQHGNIRAVGFPLFCRMLQREIRALREEFEVPKPFPKLKFPGEHYIPEEYIPSEKQIIRQYQELSACRTLNDVDQLQERWEQTFGSLPAPTQEVLWRHKFKILADDYGWEDFRYQNNRLNLRFTGDPPQELIDSARKVGANPNIRSNRLLINNLDKSSIRNWLRKIFEGSEQKEEARI